MERMSFDNSAPLRRSASERQGRVPPKVSNIPRQICLENGHIDHHTMILEVKIGKGGETVGRYNCPSSEKSTYAADAKVDSDVEGPQKVLQSNQGGLCCNLVVSGVEEWPVQSMKVDMKDDFPLDVKLSNGGTMSKDQLSCGRDHVAVVSWEMRNGDLQRLRSLWHS